jgi:biopolymer transport protein ExbD
MDRPITIQQLKDILQQKYQTPEQVVRIAVEKQVSVQKLIDLMDIVREIGYEHIFIATTVEKG